MHVPRLAAVILSTITAAACVNTATSEPVALPDPAMVKAGEVVYFQCIACHTTGPGEPHMQGPNLSGIFGAKAGAKVGFPYSEALLNSDVTWTDAAMEAWLEKPSDFIPGNLMAFIGIKEQTDREALIAYLKSVTAREYADESSTP